VDLLLKGRHALVCGASAGIGNAAAIELARLGATVSPLARSADKLADVAEDLKRAGAPQAHPIVADLEDRAALRTKVEAHLKKHGPVHILVNNQGGPPHGALLEATEEDFLKAYGRIQLASHLLVQAVLPGMRAAGYGRIVNVLSTSVREPIPGLGIGNTVRASMAAWAKTLSRELPPGITINSVLPGYTDTERLGELAEQMASKQGKSPADIAKNWSAVTPEGRLGRPEELGAVIAFLCTPAASFVRGQAWAVDGGRLNAT
jgi:3-oxoacyl-[acyl-carrier protein] reductase